MPRNCYTCFHRAGEYACALIDLKTNPCRNFDRWKSARNNLSLKEAREIAGKDRERIEESMKEEVFKKSGMDVLINNCSNCADKVYMCYGNDQYACSGWCLNLAEKEGIIRSKCNECSENQHQACPGFPCSECKHYPRKDLFKPKMPIKNRNLTWNEADKLWHEGWFLTRNADTSIEIADWDSVRDWRTEDIRATDWFVVGRRKT